MTTSNASDAVYYGNGATTDFPTTFTFALATDVVVTLTPAVGTPVVQTRGVDYEVAMPASPGLQGSVIMSTPPATGETLTIERTVDFSQEVAFRSQGSFSPAVHEASFDKVTFLTQQLHRRLQRVEAQGTFGDVEAGDGLFYVGTQLNVGAGAGLQVDASEVAVKSGVGITLAGGAVSVLFGGVGGGVARDLSGSTDTDFGAANTAARVDHSHLILTAEVPAEDISDTGATEGGSAELARADHVHNHGNRAGGSQHALATGAAHGFMSSTDKAKLDALTSFDSAIAAASLADTLSTIATISCANLKNAVFTIKLLLSAMDAAGTIGYSAEFVATFKNVSGVVSQIGATTSSSRADAGVVFNTALAFSVSGTNALLRCEVADIDMNWVGQATIIKAEKT